MQPYRIQIAIGVHIHAELCLESDDPGKSLPVLHYLRFAGDLEICLAYQNIWQEGAYLNRIIVGTIHLNVFLNRLGRTLFK